MAESLLEFPCAFPIKIIGPHRRRVRADWCSIVVLRHVPDFDSSSMEMRASREGKYLSLTCTVNASSREQLDDAIPRAVGASTGRDGPLRVDVAGHQP